MNNLNSNEIELLASNDASEWQYDSNLKGNKLAAKNYLKNLKPLTSYPIPQT